MGREDSLGLGSPPQGHMLATGQSQGREGGQYVQEAGFWGDCDLAGGGGLSVSLLAGGKDCGGRGLVILVYYLLVYWQA